MTAINRTPQNTNLFQPTKYLLTFKRIGTSQYFCQAVNVPGLSIGQALINTPGLDIYAPGNKITYNPLNITFLLNEGLQSWKDLHSWFRAIAAPTGTNERNVLQKLQTQYNIQEKSSSKDVYSDATLTVLSNLNNPILRIQFYNCFPISLSDINFDTTLSAEENPTGEASFIYDYFDFLPLDS